MSHTLTTSPLTPIAEHLATLRTELPLLEWAQVDGSDYRLVGAWMGWQPAVEMSRCDGDDWRVTVHLALATEGEAVRLRGSMAEVLDEMRPIYTEAVQW